MTGSELDSLIKRLERVQNGNELDAVEIHDTCLDAIRLIQHLVIPPDAGLISELRGIAIPDGIDGNQDEIHDSKYISVLDACDNGCNGIHFGCDCGKTVTICKRGKSIFPIGHGEDWGECAYRQSQEVKK